MKRRLHGILTLLLVLVVQIAFAQDKTVTGTVTDDEGLPLPGVNIVVKGTSKGTQTNFDGFYSIATAPGEILTYSFVGYQTVEYTVVDDRSVIDVVLGENASELDEVLVVAYGSQTEKSIVGSIVSLGEETLEKQQLTTVTEAIQGTVAGVNVIASSGQPGTSPEIRIRGIGSINASQSPLIVLDGVPYNGNLNTISGDQIASMNILKDASSTALYGSRAANGVILITTKKGNFSQAPSVSLTAVSGISSPAVDLHDVLGTNDFMRYTWEAERNNNLYVRGDSPEVAAQNASANLIQILGYNPYGTIAQPVGVDGNLVPGANLLWETDWEDEIIRDIALRNEYTVSLQGGSEDSRYFLSANYLDQEGSVKQSNFERITTRLNLESNVTDWLKMGLNSSLSTSNQNFPEQSGNSFQSSIQWIYSMSSVYPLYRRNETGGLVLDQFGDPIYDYGATPSQSVNGSRPLLSNENAAGSLYNYDNENKRTSIVANGFVEIEFTDWLTGRSNLSYENYLFDGFTYAAYDVGYAANVGGRVSQDRDVTTTLNFTNSLRFEKGFGDHNVQADAIFETYELKIDAMGAQGIGFLPGVKVLNGSTTPESVSGFINEERLVSYLGRLAYNYKERYFVEGSFRRDGSSRFSEDTRWGNFFSVGGSWIVSDEAFLSNVDAIDILKLKASYGELGNNQGIGYFPYLQLFETGWNELDNTGVLLGGVTDPKLSWETTALFNAGIDFGLFDSRLEGSVEYYERESIDLIYAQPLPESTGNSDITTNVGSLKNSGVEAALTGHVIRNQNVQWSLSANAAFTKNEITELTQDEFINGTKKWKEGKSLYDFFIQEWAGVDPADGYGMWYTDVLDENGEATGEKVTTKDYSEATRYYQGSSLPDVTGGFSTDLVIGNFDFNALFNFSIGSQVYDSSYAGLVDGFSRPGYQASPDLADRWQQPGDVTDIPLLLNAQNDFNSQSTRFLFDNDYLRMRAITFGYSLPQSTLEDLGLERLRLYVRGDNMFTWQSHEGIDPEQSVAGTTNSRSYPMKTISVGLNVQF